jgi:GT2 family glycosyltransferase
MAVDAIVGCCALIRREVFESVGLFSGELFYGFEDLELCLRASAAGFRTVCQPAATVWHLGARTIGRTSPARLYFAARNHLRVAERAAPLALLPSALRAAALIGFNLAHALITAPAPRWAGVRAVMSGVADHVRGRYGPLPKRANAWNRSST